MSIWRLHLIIKTNYLWDNSQTSTCHLFSCQYQTLLQIFFKGVQKKLWNILEYNDILLLISYVGKGQEWQCKQKLCKRSMFFNQLSYNIVHKGSHKKLDNTASSGKKKFIQNNWQFCPFKSCIRCGTRKLFSWGKETALKRETILTFNFNSSFSRRIYIAVIYKTTSTKKQTIHFAPRQDFSSFLLRAFSHY